MTVQLAIANSYGIAMASDRHVFRDGPARSTGQEQKLLRLRTGAPAAMMAAGPLAILDTPVSRLALEVERAVRSAENVGRPEALAVAVLDALTGPVPRGPDPIQAAVQPAPAGGPDARSSRPASCDLYVTVGLCCPATGVPVLVSLRLWRGLGDRLEFASRLESDYEAIWRSNRTVVVAQGAGRPIVEAMVDGIAGEHWGSLSAATRAKIGPSMSARWDRAHDRIAVSSLREMGAIATGLVRGAEVIGYLTREGEGTVAPVDCVVLTPGGTVECGLHAGEYSQYERGIPSTCCPT
ncbi:MAG: hypothetical protein J0H14_00535 [Alphaproteobacteria bacterium]|nr:hypothetical protein [Alphaproteobacteria bacterium]